ncbi:PREDICTED: uncharacterized protein LOC107066936 [Polistes dominula]|uniref:RING-type E3 ubiquitin transferase n=1 Tax=Polistes dominula TaxID=743375 RepID=A0ABM1IBA6_POLDO|nr:PREDICTED: uncharacterized protein LOC107066936 [Polistes dominula]
MATYLKRTSKLFDISLLRSSADVNIRDLMCPVCRGLLIEPVTLPCTHNLCLRCLKGTFEHNSLSCPLCRVRVGSWLRTATKSETLVNNALWDLIRTKFPKEVENKYNGNDGESELDIGLSARSKILSAAGEIRREYEAQLQMAEEEMRRRRENEDIASEALIRKLQVEEQQQQFAQIAQDQLLAQNLAKKQLVDKQKEVKLYQNECVTSSVSNCPLDTSKFDTKSMPLLNTEMFKFDGQSLETRKIFQKNIPELKNSSELRRSNVALISKMRAERYSSNVKPNTSNAYKDPTAKFCCQKSVPIYNSIARTLKHQVVTKFTQPGTSNYSLEPGCSTSKIYGMQSKEELRVPSDVLNSKKKSLGVEVCVTSGNGDERIGSAESAGSHDSINQEIHHFKPIKAMPRTPFKMSIDGKQIEPKLVRVIPVLKRISNALPKAPSPTHLKRIIGCSWSAFKGKIRQDMKIKEIMCNSKEKINEVEQHPSTSLTHQFNDKLFKSQIHDAIRRLDLISDLSFDSNKNYAKNINKTINGTKVSKKQILDEHVTSGKVQKTWKSQIKNGMVGKSKRQKNMLLNRKDVELTLDKEEVNDNVTSSDSLLNNPKERLECNEQEEDSRDNPAVENIAERIKKRKVNVKRKNSQVEQDKILEVDSEEERKSTTKRSVRKRALSRKSNEETSTSEQSAVTVQKRVKLNCSHKPTLRNKSENIKDDVDSLNKHCNTIHGLRKSNRNIKTVVNNSFPKHDQEVLSKENPNNNKRNCDRLSPCLASEETLSDNNAHSAKIVDENVLSNEEVIKEQERIERLVLQEKADFEFAKRLQAKFNEMERIAGRTRRSRKAIESEDISLDLYKIEVGRTVHKVASTHTAKRSTLNQTVSSETKQRGRPRKSVK